VAALVMVAVFASSAVADLVIPSEVVQSIDTILTQPIRVYDLDHGAEQKILSRVDEFFSQHFDSRRAEKISDPDGTYETLRDEPGENKPIPLFSGEIPTLNPEAPVVVWYTKEPGMRRFFKRFQAPSPTKLPNDDVELLARDFLLREELCKETSGDRIGRAQVTTHVRRKRSADRSAGPQEFLRQRAVITRELFGLEVVNSRQIVEVHPESRELLAYKSLRWTPILLPSGREHQLLSRDEVLQEIKDAYDLPGVEQLIEAVVPVYFLTERFAVPCVAVHPEIRDDQTAPGRIVVFSIVRDIPLGR
jgi:hypothetical protein